MDHKLAVVIKAIDEKKGKNVVAYAFSQLNPFIDYTVIAEANNYRQVYALANHVKEQAKEAGITVLRMEGDQNSSWILVDLDTIIVHIFLSEAREVFRLEQLYGDLPSVDVVL